MSNTLNIYQKLAAARNTVAAMNLQKAGYNTYSNYDYFTPEQVAEAERIACDKHGLVTIYNLPADMIATLDVIDTEQPESKITFRMLTSIPEITATNATQQLGGAVTYSKRYLTMTAFGITDNSLDPDSTTPKTAAGSKKVTPKADKTYNRSGDANSLRHGEYIEIGGVDYIYKVISKGDKVYRLIEDPNKKKPGSVYNVSYFSGSEIYDQLVDQWARECEAQVSPDDLPF